MGGFPESSPSNSPRKRILILGVIFFLVVVAYVIYLFGMQIVQGQEYETRARQVARQVVPIPAQRGEIYDRYYDVPLVMNVNSFAVEIIPGELTNKELDTVLSRLSSALNISVKSLEAKITSEFRNLYNPVELASNVSYETIIYLAEHKEQFPGITWRSKQVRRYLESGSISHVLGYVGTITSEELQILYNQGYNAGTTLGKTGIEKMYDKVLRGTDGKRYKTVDVTGRSVQQSIHSEVPPENGNDLVLTIDRHIQRLCEQALGDRVGSALVLRPSNGEVLAMVSYPWYDPNLFYKKDGEKRFSELSNDPMFPFLNRTIQSAYAPASTFKVIMTSAVLGEEAFDPQDTVTCRGSLRLGDRTFHCWKRSGHGPMDLPHALAQSCNVFFYTMGHEHLGVDSIVKYARDFGFGRITGVDLPGEVSGVIPTPEWKEKNYHTPWVGGDTVNMSIGQGYTTVTPLQMANALALLVNEGEIYRPHLVREIRDPVSGKLLREIDPDVLHKSSLEPELFREVKDAMRLVITDGTARYVVSTNAVDPAGKTGTGQTSHSQSGENFNSWFVAFAPYDAPPEEQLVLVIMVESVNEWEWWAPKAANIILQGIFAEQDYDEAVDSLNAWYLR
ncbi:MAG: penicillin-binding protein 2 [Spirochaetales bacterium]|nr:penicillin-binding protein 2 [Spirochaetales bacterium]